MLLIKKLAWSTFSLVDIDSLEVEKKFGIDRIFLGALRFISLLSTEEYALTGR
jgi:hypothetical protein